jgi:tetratricopeptide (TPR) repeat protein
MQHIESILDEVKQKVEADLAKARRKVALISLFGTIAFALFFAVWLSFWKLPLYLYWIVVVIAPIVLYIYWKKELRKLLWQDYYESELEALQNEPQTADDYFLRGDTLAGYDYQEAAIEDWRKAVELEPENDRILYEIMYQLWYEMDNGEEALLYAERLAAIEGDDQAEALTIYGRILTTTDPETALASINKAIELAPDDANCRLARLRLFLVTDRLCDAAAVVDEMSTEMRKSSFTLEKAEFAELQGILAMKQQDPKTAVKHFSRAIRFCSDNEKYYILRAEAHEALGDIFKADADKQKADKFK